jgi:hypothetical protein
MNWDDQNAVRAVAVGCVLLLTASLVPATAGVTLSEQDTPETSSVAAQTASEPVASPAIEQTDSRTLAAESHSDEGCVVDSFGSVYPNLVGVQCGQSESGNTSLALGGSGGWAYVMYLDIHPGASNTGILGRGGEVITRIGSAEVEGSSFARRWSNALPTFNDEVVIVRQSSYAVDAYPRSDELFFYAHEPGSIFQSIPPGVYNLRVVVYKKMGPSTLEGDYVARAIREAPRQESELTVELGPCEADYNAEQRLENVDENILDTYEELGEAKAKYSEARRSFGDNVRSLTDSILSGGTKAALKKGAKLKDILTGAVDFGDLNTVASIQDDLEKGTQAQKSFDKRVTDVKELQSKKSAILDGVERCNGEPYNIERYDAPSSGEVQDAMNAGSDGQ